MTELREGASGPIVEVADPSELAFTVVPLVEGPGQAEANQALLQGALDAGLRLVQLPAGTFELDQVFLPAGTYLRGHGPLATTLVWVTDPIEVDDGPEGLINVHNANGVRLERFRVDGNKANITVGGSASPSNIHCFSLKNASSLEVVEARAENAVSNGFHCFSTSRVEMLDCFALFCGLAGYTPSGLSSVMNCTAQVCGTELVEFTERGNFYIRPATANCNLVSCVAIGGELGFNVFGAGTQLIGCVARVFSDRGFYVNAAQVTMAECFAQGQAGSVGFELQPQAPRCALVGCIADGQAVGYSVQADNTLLVACRGRQNTSDNVEIISNDNAVVACVVGAISDSGTGSQFVANF